MTELVKKNNEFNCWENETQRNIYYYTLLDKIEIAFFDKKEQTLYLNTKYDKKFISLSKKLKSHYNTKKGYKHSEYLNVEGLGF